MATKLRNTPVRNFDELALMLRQWAAVLNNDLRWLGPTKFDPELPQHAEWWFREDEPSLRIRVNGKTYKIVMEEV